MTERTSSQSQIRKIKYKYKALKQRESFWESTETVGSVPLVLDFSICQLLLKGNRMVGTSSQKNGLHLGMEKKICNNFTELSSTLVQM